MGGRHAAKLGRMANQPGPSWTDLDDDDLRIAWFEGPRDTLRPLFELADDSSRQIDAYIDRGRVLAALVDGTVIGHALLLPGDQPDVVELKSIAVLDDLQGRGVGRALVRHAAAACRRDGARALTVTTATADVGNIRFYQRCGFRAYAIRRDAFTEANGYPSGLTADGIPVRDAISFTLALDEASNDRA
jgi:ribosomal protein S18 acetylase RimI-like enzyme